MKQVKLGSLKDGAKFKISKRKSGVTYKTISKKKSLVEYTSLKSELSFTGHKSKLVYPC